MKITFNKIFFFLFTLVWAGFILFNVVTPPKVFSENENRYLAEFPKFSYEKLIDGNFMKEIDGYINDHFILRDRWIGMKTLMERITLKQDINSVYFAKDDYLIEKHNYSDISEEQADKNREYLTQFVDQYVSKLGKEHVKVMLVPTASEVLTDKLPPFATGYSQTAYMNKVNSSLPESTFLDIKDTLMEHKDEYIYYKTDHHWTTQGAYYAYEQWARSAGLVTLKKEQFDITLASDQFYGTLHSKVNTNVKPDHIYLYKLNEDMKYQLIYNLEKKTDTLYDLDKLEGKDKYSVFMGGNNALIEVQTSNRNGRKLLVIKDSYAHCFVPFAVNHYEKTYVIDPRYFNGGVEELVEKNGITDVLVLYNVIGFTKDINIGKILN